MTHNPENPSHDPAASADSSAPATPAPESQAPESQAPESQAPASQAPESQAPASPAPATPSAYAPPMSSGDYPRPASPTVPPAAPTPDPYAQRPPAQPPVRPADSQFDQSRYGAPAYPTGGGTPPYGAGAAAVGAPAAFGSMPPAGRATVAPVNSDAPVKRSATVGLVAALAVGALVGGVSGAGVTAFALNSTSSNQATTVSGPTNITVNDPQNATTVTAVAAQAAPSVVTISVSASGGASGTGSGVILTEDGFVVTNSHVVTLDGSSSQPSITVQMNDGRIFRAEVVGTDPISDLAVIKIDGGDTAFPAAEFADSSKLNVGDSAVAIGAPLGLAGTVTDGIVSALNRSITVASSAVPDGQTEEAPDSGQNPFDFWQNETNPNQAPQTASSTIALSVIQTDAAINPGNSGGALLDSEGRVIGINVAIASAGAGQSGATSGSIGVGFAIPSNLAKRIANEIMDSGSGSHGLLGATVGDVSADTATVVGASIESITNGGAAESGGLRQGDVITAINGTPVAGKTDLTAQVRALAAGAEAEIAYQRDGRSATTTVTLGSLD